LKQGGKRHECVGVFIFGVEGLDGEEQKLNPGQNTGSAVHRLSRDVMTVAFIGISYVQFRKYTIEDCVN